MAAASDGQLVKNCTVTIPPSFRDSLLFWGESLANLMNFFFLVFALYYTIGMSVPYLGESSSTKRSTFQRASALSHGTQIHDSNDSKTFVFVHSSPTGSTRTFSRRPSKEDRIYPCEFDGCDKRYSNTHSRRQVRKTSQVIMLYWVSTSSDNCSACKWRLV